MAQSYGQFRHLSVKIAKIGAGVRRAQNFECSKDSTMDNYKIHQTAVNTPHPTNESDEDDFDYGAFQFHQTGSSTTTPPWANGSWSQTDQSRQGQWQYFGWEHDPSEYHTVATFVHKDHSLETVSCLTLTAICQLLLQL